MRRWLRILLLGALVLVAGIQLVPVDRSNPPEQGVVPAPPPVLAVLQRSCFDCHSNQTRWPWYAYVAPVSWRVADDVHEGRKELNFQEWNRASARKRARVAAKVWDEVQEGKMPLPNYLRMHPEARLSEEDRALLRGWAETSSAAR
ncbi:MAG TPA: heme-binding domain-containing protein [Candidatus Polarisedimenticolaceae bacterium]|nr:heme-binding domain-containing protein [Candidatus Polarisedimenticolaceae bacterium]